MTVSPKNNSFEAKDIDVLVARYEREHRYLEFLERSGQILSESLDWKETTANVCRSAVETIADLCMLALGKVDDLEVVAGSYRDADRIIELHSPVTSLHDKARVTGDPVLPVVTTGQSVLVGSVDDSYLRSKRLSVQHRQFMRTMGYRSLMIVPVVSQTGGIMGALTLVRTDATEERYDSEALKFAEELGRRCGVAIAKARLYAKTLAISNSFQRAALPATLPKHDGIAIDAFYEPSSEEMLVGGDWFDAFELADGRIAVTIGDVLGHGLEAAVWMSRIRNGLRAALFAKPDAAVALAIADQLLLAESRDAFTTAIVALIDPVHQTLSCATAGHPGPLVWDGSGDVIDVFDHRDLPLGLRGLGNVTRTSQMLTLTPSSFVTFFTDGLLEYNRNIEQAWHRLKSAIARQDVRESLHPAHAIYKAVVGEAPHADDIAILTARWDQINAR